MISRLFPMVAMLVMAGVSACAASTDAVERVGTTASAIGVQGSVPYPKAPWGGTIVDVMAADAWAQCGAHVSSAAELATDSYLTYLGHHIDDATCPEANSLSPTESDFDIAGCDTSCSSNSKMKRWAWQRQILKCNVDTSTGDEAKVTFYGNGPEDENGPLRHTTLTPSLFTALGGTALSGAIASAQREVDIAEVNLCMAQRLRENMASADSLFLSGADLRQLLEVVRERAQIAMTQYALLARVFTNPHDPNVAPDHPEQAFIPLMYWSKQSATQPAIQKALKAMGRDLAAAVELHIASTRELAEFLARSASARLDRAGASTSDPQTDFGSGSWRQRLLALLYGGNPLRAAATPSEIDPAALSSEELAATQIAWSVPWDTAWTEDLVTQFFPNFVTPVTPAQRYAKTPTPDPQVRQLLALAREADALYLKDSIADRVLTGLLIGDTGTFSFRRIDIDASAPQVWALVEAWLRTEECKKTNPNCSIGVDDPAMPAPNAYAKSILWKKYAIDPSHATTLVSMLADIVPLVNEGESGKWVFPSWPSVPYELEGAMHVTGASRQLEARELDARLPGHGAGVWFRLDPAFTVVAFGNAERAPLYTTTTSRFFPRSFDKTNVPRSQGFGDKPRVNNLPVPSLRQVGAVSALTLARELLEDSVAGASASLTQSYLATVGPALELIDSAIGHRSISIRPATTTQNLYRNCSDFDPSSSTVRTCPTIVQTIGADGLTAQWNVSVRTEVDDPFFDTAVSLVVVPYAGGTETAAAIDPNYTSFKGVTRPMLLESARVEVALSAPSPLGTTAVQREATVTLPLTTAITSYLGGPRNSFTVFLKRTKAGQTEYRLLAQQVALSADIDTRATSSTTTAKVGLPVEGQFLAYGGVLGQMAARAWATRSDDWSKPAYDGFDLQTDWVPPFDPTLLGNGADDASATYLSRARAAADEATGAVKSAIDELLKEQADSATLASARTKAAGIIQLELRSFCGGTTGDCDISTVDADLETYFAEMDCLGGNLLCESARETRARVVPSRVRLAKAVYERRFDGSAPAFNEYSGGKLQGVLLEQWGALRKLRELIAETAEGVYAQQGQNAAASAELNQLQSAQAYECSAEAMKKAFHQGFSYPDVNLGGLREGAWEDAYDILRLVLTEDDYTWSPGPALAQVQACDRAKLAIAPAYARHAAVVAQGWAWLASRTTLLLDAGTALQAASARFAAVRQESNLAQAQARLEARLVADNLQTKFGTYRRYHSYDVWRARALLESTRRYAAAARRAIEARYVVDLSEMRADEPFVAAPATWADEIYEYDLAAPSSVGLTALPTSGGIYPNRLIDYVGNLERFVSGYAVARPTAIAQNDDELFHVSGPDVRVDGSLSGDVAAWEFRCPNGAWVQHPGLQAATQDVPIATICDGVSPIRARVSFSLDSWGRLNGGIADAPYTKRHNARWRELAVNVVGTGVRDCAMAADPNGCYANAYLRYNLTHVGPAWVTNFDEQWRSLGVPIGSIEGAKALTAEQWLDPTGNGFSKPYVVSVARTEFAGRPVSGTYQFELEVTPDVRLSRIERVQVLMRSNYWVKQAQSGSPPVIDPEPTLAALNYDLADPSGGDAITITGTDLGSATSCTVGGTNATIISNTSTSLTFRMPAKAGGTHYDVRVTTPGGVSNPLSIEAWSPAQVGGIDAYFDARKGIVMPVGQFPSWQEQAAGRSYMQMSALSRPTRIADFFGTGSPAVRFSPTQYLSAMKRVLSSGLSYFWVSKWTSSDTASSTAPGVPLTVIGDTGGGVGNAAGAAGGSLRYAQQDTMGSWTQTDRGSGLNDGTTRLVGWTHATDGTLRAWAGATQLGADALQSYSVGSNGYDSVGTSYAGNDGWDGDVGAIIIVGGVISGSDLAKLHKWSRAGFGAD